MPGHKTPQKMKLLIDPAGGMAGDMFMAALISAGADAKLVKNAILAAGKKLGTARADIDLTPDGSTRIHIQLKSHRHHLSQDEAIRYLNELFVDFGIDRKYSRFGMKILQVLLQAEKKAHRQYHITLDDPHLPLQPGSHRHKHHEVTLLHEAQDIVIDIIGAVVGSQNLGIDPRAFLSNPVSVGSGTIHFSHGTFGVPAPATRVILETHHIEWKAGPIDKELCTPTGAAILAALQSTPRPPDLSLSLKPAIRGKSRGSHIYDIPPLVISLG